MVHNVSPYTTYLLFFLWFTAVHSRIILAVLFYVTRRTHSNCSPINILCTMKEVVFYYDLVCPFAYMASRLIEGVAQRTGARIQWKPVLLGKLSSLSE